MNYCTISADVFKTVPVMNDADIRLIITYKSAQIYISENSINYVSALFPCESNFIGQIKIPMQIFSKLRQWNTNTFLIFLYKNQCKIKGVNKRQELDFKVIKSNPITVLNLPDINFLPIPNNLRVIALPNPIKSKIKSPSLFGIISEGNKVFISFTNYEVGCQEVYNINSSQGLIALRLSEFLKLKNCISKFVAIGKDEKYCWIKLTNGYFYLDSDCLAESKLKSFYNESISVKKVNKDLLLPIILKLNKSVETKTISMKFQSNELTITVQGQKEKSQDISDIVEFSKPEPPAKPEYYFEQTIKTVGSGESFEIVINCNNLLLALKYLDSWCIGFSKSNDKLFINSLSKKRYCLLTQAV